MHSLVQVEAAQLVAFLQSAQALSLWGTCLVELKVPAWKYFKFILVGFGYHSKNLKTV